MAMDAYRLAKEIDEEFERRLRLDSDFNSEEFLYFLNKAIDDQFQKADKNFTNFDITPPAGTLKIKDCIKDYTDESTSKEFVNCISRAIVEYWRKAVRPGEPVELDNVISVVNDAEKIYRPLINDINSLAEKCSMNNELKPYYFEFCNIIIKNVRDIRWVIVEERRTTGGIERKTFIGQVN